MTRLWAAVAAGIVCGAAGMRQARSLRARAAELRRWEALLRRLALLLRTRPAPLPGLFEDAADETALPDRLMRQLAQALRDHPLTPLSAHLAALEIAAPQGAILARLAPRLSAGNPIERADAVQGAAEEIALAAAAHIARAERDARMWTQLGWTAGACLTLLLV